MLAIPNEHQIGTFRLTSRYTVRADPSTKLAYAGIVAVEWSGDLMMRPAGFEEWLTTIGQGNYTPDGFLRMVFDELWRTLEPNELAVALTCESTAHGSYELTLRGWLETVDSLED